MMRQMAAAAACPGMPGMPGDARDGPRQEGARASSGQGREARPRAAARGNPAKRALEQRQAADRPRRRRRPGGAAATCPRTSSCPPSSSNLLPPDPALSVTVRPARPRLHVRGVVLPDGERPRPLGRRRPHHRTSRSPTPTTIADAAGSCPAWSTRTATSGSTPTARSPRRRAGGAGAHRPRRRRAAAPRRRRAARHPLDRRPRRPAADRPGRPAHRADQALHPQLRRRGRAGRPGRRGRAAGRARRRLGQAGRRLDRPRARRPRALLAGRRARGRDRPRPRARRPGHRARVRRASRCPTCSTPASTASSTAPGSPTTWSPRWPRRGTALVPDPGPDRELPDVRRPGRARSSRRTPRTCATCTPGPTPSCGRPTRPACRSSPAPTPAASLAARPGRPGGGGAARRGRAHAGRRAGCRVVAGPRAGSAARARWPRATGRLRGVRRRPAGRPARPGRTRPGSSCAAASSPDAGADWVGAHRSGIMARCTRRTADPLIRCVPRPPAGTDRTPTRTGAATPCEQQELHHPWQSRSS